jgi:hypothetical protein
VPDKANGESFEAWVRRSGNRFDGDCDVVVYQMPYLHNGIRRAADFVVRVQNPVAAATLALPRDRHRYSGYRLRQSRAKSEGGGDDGVRNASGITRVADMA